MRASWAYQNPGILRQTVAGVTFDNPIGLSAGLDKNFQLATLMKHVGFGFMEGGSLTLHPYTGNARPWFHRLPKSQSLVVNAGLANHGVRRIIERILRYPASTFEHFPLNISVAKTNSPDACTPKDAVAD
jgi:dihydroorotate dehydrogenase (fumarate)